MDGIELKVRRIRARLSQWRVASALGYSSAWLCEIERSATSVAPEVANRIVEAIDELANQTVKS